MSVVRLEESREALLQRLSTGALSDALDSLGVDCVASPTLRRVGGAQRKFFGRAYTICWAPARKGRDIRAAMPSTWEQVRDFLAPAVTDGRGLVYVSGSSGGESIDRFALAGGLSSRHFDSLGIEAMVLGGAMRDVDELAARRMPIWATATSPADTQGNYRVMSAGAACSLAGLRVTTGDWVFGDGTGVVVLPQALANEAVDRALAIVDAEAELERRLDAGESLLAVLERSGHI